MANTKSALKRIRQNHGQRTRNRARLSTLRSAIKRVRTAVETGDAETARTLLQPTLALIDRTRSRGVIHGNAAARRKSRLVRLVGTLEG